MPRFAVKELISLTVVTYVEAETAEQAEELVEMMDIFDFDRLVDSSNTFLKVWEEEDTDQ